jgi:hypothetical protein
MLEIKTIPRSDEITFLDVMTDAIIKKLELA